MKKLILLFFTFMISICSVLANEVSTILKSEIGIVQKVEYIDLNDNTTQTKQDVILKLKDGSQILVENMLTGNPYYDIKLKKGKKVVLHVEETEYGDKTYSIEDISRSSILLWLSLIFCGLLIYVGKEKGLFSLISIVIACILITNLLTPMILHGINPVLATILICLLATAATIYFVGGFNLKSTAATISCIISIVIAGAASYITVLVASLSGFSNENSLFLYATHPELNFAEIAIATIIIAALGAVMDVSMSIASTINEIYTIDNTKTAKELFTSGMNVGRDIIGTMANTLILVYMGTSLPLILLVSNIDMQKFLNLNQVVTEIASALIGSSAIVLCVPITAVITSNLLKNKKSEANFSNIEI